MTNRTTCPDCELEGKHKPNVGIYEDGLYCFRCEKLIKTDDEPMKELEPFLEGELLPNGMPKRLISKETTDAFKITYAGNKVIFPYYKNNQLVMQKTKTGNKEYSIINYDKEADMFGSHLHDNSRKNIIITEGEEDAMAVYQSLGGGALRSINHVTSLPRGAGSASEFIKNHYQTLVQYDYVTLCFDEDEAGQKALEKVIPLFSKNKIKVVKIPRKDACEMLINHQQEELKWAVLKADTVTPKGIIRMSDLTDSFFDYEPPQGVELPFPQLNHALAGLRKGELTMMAGGCVDAETEFFNGYGWTKIKDWSPETNIGTIDNNFSLTLEAPLKYHKYEEKALLHIQTKYGLDMVLSTQHKVAYVTDKIPEKIQLIEMYNLAFKHHNQKTGFRGKIPTTFNLLERDNKVTLSDGDLVLSVIIFADGHFEPKSKTQRKALLRFKRPRKIKRFLCLAEKYKWKYKEHKGQNGFRVFYIEAALPGVKHYEDFWYNLNEHQRELVFNEIFHWDGSLKKNQAGFYSNSKLDCDFVQFISSGLGYRATVESYLRRTGKVEWRTTVCLTKARNVVGLRNSNKHEVKINYYYNKEGHMYCFTTRTGLWLARRNGRIFITGNSGLGKSIFATNIIYDMVVNKGLKVVDIKLEEDKKKTIFTYAGMYFDNRNYAIHPKTLTPTQRLEFRLKFEQYITHDHFGSLTSKELLDVLEYYALSEKVDFIFLDHISMAISGTVSSKEGERKDIDILVTKIRELINTSNVGFVCISHLSNPSSGGTQWEEGRKVNRSALRGSGALAQLSDNIIGIEGDLTEEETKNYRQIRLLKTRYGREQETLCDTFVYDGDTGKIHLANTKEPF